MQRDTVSLGTLFGHPWSIGYEMWSYYNSNHLRLLIAVLQCWVRRVTNQPVTAGWSLVGWSGRRSLFHHRTRTFLHLLLRRYHRQRQRSRLKVSSIQVLRYIYIINTGSLLYLQLSVQSRTIAKDKEHLLMDRTVEFLFYLYLTDSGGVHRVDYGHSSTTGWLVNNVSPREVLWCLSFLYRWLSSLRFCFHLLQSSINSIKSTNYWRTTACLNHK